MVVFMHKQDPLSWILMPTVLDRIRKFIEKYNCDGPADKMLPLIQQHFISDNPLILTLAGVENGEVWGHALVCIDALFDNRWMTILQTQIDRPMSKEVEKDTWDKLLAWGKSKGAKEVQLLTPSNNRALLFAKKYGFRTHRIQMRRSIEG
jgi:hypothetical protein